MATNAAKARGGGRLGARASEVVAHLPGGVGRDDIPAGRQGRRDQDPFGLQVKVTVPGEPAAGLETGHARRQQALAEGRIEEYHIER